MGGSQKVKKGGNTPTILLTAEPSNFRDVVQQFTGRPKENSIERSLLLKPVPKRPEAKQLSASTCQWFSSLSATSSTSESFSPQLKSSLPLESTLKDRVEDEELSVSNSLIATDFLDLHNDIVVSFDSGELEKEMECFLGYI
ncbi:hypothetical protein SUGI_0815160 [Cryptomeria japonica]|nr:hypothetical protein SUGI_0815160 [Cryptomeria japonica]